MTLTGERFDRLQPYLATHFGREDPALEGVMERAVAQGIPDIAVDALVGRLLLMLAKTASRGGAADSLALEVGTLAGYSGTWIARGLAPGGRLITIDIEAAHAAFAQETFERAGVAGRVDARVGAALSVLPALRTEIGDESVDFLFIDAVKREYEAYLDAALPMLRAGALIVADNALGSSWRIEDPPGESEDRDGVARFNERLASDPRFDSVMVPLRDGVAVARLAE